MQQVEDDLDHNELRYKAVIGGAPVFVHISYETWDDVLRGNLSAERQRQIENIVAQRSSVIPSSSAPASSKARPKRSS